MIAVACIYAKGYEGGSGLQEGLRFGLLIAIFNAGYVIGADYGILNIGRPAGLIDGAGRARGMAGRRLHDRSDLPVRLGRHSTEREGGQGMMER